MKKIAPSLRRHRELILNYFRAQKLLSSGVVEGLNNKAKATVRESCVLRTYRVLELALYHSLGKLPEPESPTISSVQPFYWMMRFRMAYSTMSAVLCRLSFCMMRLRWVSTVYRLTLRMFAASLLDFPSASSCSTSFSRSVNRS